MKRVAVILLELLLALLALVQVVRVVGRDPNDRFVGAALLVLFIVALVAVHKWYKGKSPKGEK